VIRISKTVVVDHKTSSKKYSELETSKSLQPTIYGMSLGLAELEFYYHQAMAVQNPYINPIKVIRNQNDYEWAKTLIEMVWQQIQTGIFAPNPSGWWCSKDSCQFWSQCHMPKDW